MSGLIPPRDLALNQRYRAWLWKRADQNKRVREAILERCAADFQFWVDSFIWQYNPRVISGPKLAPWVSWDYEVEAFRAIGEAMSCNCREQADTHQHDLLIKKSREMGVSWAVLLRFDHPFLFSSWNKFMCVSRNQDAVDNHDPDSLFWKLEHAHRYLPEWMLPGGHIDGIKRRENFFGNEVNHSSITGAPTTEKIGVGGRCTAMLIDEFAQIKQDTEVLNRTSDTSYCRIFVSTHVGTATEFYALSKRADMRQLEIHWTRHPKKRRGLYRAIGGQLEVLDKTYPFDDYRFNMTGLPSGGPHPGVRSPWYDTESNRKGSARAVAEDLDINPEGSVSQVFDPLMIIPLKEEFCRAPLWEGDLLYDHETARPTGLSPRKGGPLRFWCPLVMREGLLRPPPGWYSLGVDVAAGSGTTPSCISGGDIRTGEKILEYANGFILPDPLGRLTVALMRLLKNQDGGLASMTWEDQGPGATLGKTVVDLLRESDGTGCLWRGPASLTDPSQRRPEPGWHSNMQFKRDAIEQLRTALYERKFLNRSEEALKETLLFKYRPDGGVEHAGEASPEDYSGARTNHGDRVIADALCWKQIQDADMLRLTTKAQEPETQVGSLEWRRMLHKRSETRPQLARMIAGR